MINDVGTANKSNNDISHNLQDSMIDLARESVLVSELENGISLSKKVFHQNRGCSSSDFEESQ